LRSDDRVVRIEQGMPVTVADLRSGACRVHDVGEQHRGEHTVVGHFCLVPGEELGDLLEGRAPSRFNELVDVASRQFDVLCVRYAVSDVLAHRGQDDRVVGVNMPRRNNELVNIVGNSSVQPTLKKDNSIRGVANAVIELAHGVKHSTAPHVAKLGIIASSVILLVSRC
jgi:hypothetical protein